MVNFNSVQDVWGGAERDRLGLELCLEKESVEGALLRVERGHSKALAKGNRKKGTSSSDIRKA